MDNPFIDDLQVCFICDTELTVKSVKLIDSITRTSGKRFPNVISSLLSDDFFLLVGEDDAVCWNCSNLMHELDRLQLEVHTIRTKLSSFLCKKYDITLNELSPSQKEEEQEDLLIKSKRTEEAGELPQEKQVKADVTKAKSSHQCPSCSAELKGIDSFRIHLKSCLETEESPSIEDSELLSLNEWEKEDFEVELSDIPYQCALCNESFSTSEDLNKHVDQHSVNDTINSDSSSLPEILDHDQYASLNDEIDGIINESKLICCYLCGRNFSSQLQYKKHLKLHNESTENDSDHEGSLFLCPICDLTCKKKSHFVKHCEGHLKANFLNIIPQRDLSPRLSEQACEICMQVFPSLKELAIHFKVHNSNKCPSCSKEFPSDLKLKEHLVIHEAKVGPDQCEFCLEKFSCRSELENHMGTSHGNSKSIRYCPICGNRSATLLGVKRHVLKVHMVPVLQEEIRRNYATGSDLISNMKDAGASDELIKTICSEKSDKKPKARLPLSLYVCYVCGYLSKDLNKIINHQKRHAVLCPVCPTQFPGENELCLHLQNKHKISLTPSTCIYCLKSVSSNLDTHFRSQHYAMFSHLVCFICKKMFWKKSDISEHVRERHLSKEGSKYIGPHLDCSMPETTTVNIVGSSSDEVNLQCVDIPADFMNTANGEESMDLELSVALSSIQNDNEKINNENILVVFKCGECGFTGTKVEVEKHLENHNNDSSNGHKELDLQSDLSEHQKELNSDFPDEENNVKEKNIAEQNYSCSYCLRRFSSEIRLLRHETEYHVLIKQCGVCGKEFCNMMEFLLHRDFEHRDKPLKCKYCDRDISDVHKLKKHEAMHKVSPKKGIYSCGECGKMFKTPSGLRVHRMKHTGLFPFICKICGKGLPTKYALSEHKAIHSDEPRFCCDVCGKSFRLYDTYHRHRRLHDNPFPFECADCGEKFRSSSRLSEHRRRRHTGERPYKCPFCPAMFNVTSSYHSHICLHTRVFPYNCKSCGRGFPTRIKYANHLASKHEDYSLLTAKSKKNLQVS